MTWNARYDLPPLVNRSFYNVGSMTKSIMEEYFNNTALKIIICECKIRRKGLHQLEVITIITDRGKQKYWLPKCQYLKCSILHKIMHVDLVNWDCEYQI